MNGHDYFSQKLDINEDSGEIKLYTEFTCDAFLRQLKHERKRIGRGYSKGHKGFAGNLRKKASIRPIDLMFWKSMGDGDAVALLDGDTTRLDSFLASHPEYRASEGAL